MLKAHQPTGQMLASLHEFLPAGKPVQVTMKDCLTAFLLPV